MARSSSTFIDAIEALPITGSTMRFHATSGGEVQCFNMERSTAIKVAYDILRCVEDADVAECKKLVRLTPGSHHAAALGE